MKIKVVSEFYDKFHTSTLFPVGAVVDFEESRAKDIIQRKLGVPYVEPKVGDRKEAPNPKAPAVEQKAAEEEPAVKEQPETAEPAKANAEEAKTETPKEEVKAEDGAKKEPKRRKGKE